MYRFYCNVAPLRQTWGEIAAILNTEVGADRGNRNARPEAIHLTHDDEVEEAEDAEQKISSEDDDASDEDDKDENASGDPLAGDEEK